MRLLLAGVVAVAAFALAAPSFAQSEEPSGGTATPAPAPTAKPAKGTAAYCQTLKSSSNRKSCLQKLHAQASPKNNAGTTTAAKKKKKPAASPAPTAAPGNSAQYTPPAAAAPGSTSGPVAVPPLPQKTI